MESAAPAYTCCNAIIGDEIVADGTLMLVEYWEAIDVIVRFIVVFEARERDLLSLVLLRADD